MIIKPEYKISKGQVSIKKLFKIKYKKNDNSIYIEQRKNEMKNKENRNRDQSSKPIMQRSLRRKKWKEIINNLI